MGSLNWTSRRNLRIVLVFNIGNYCSYFQDAKDRPAYQTLNLEAGKLESGMGKQVKVKVWS
jgi:hypothetical protein